MFEHGQCRGVYEALYGVKWFSHVPTKQCSLPSFDLVISLRVTWVIFKHTFSHLTGYFFAACQHYDLHNIDQTLWVKNVSRMEQKCQNGMTRHALSWQDGTVETSLSGDFAVGTLISRRLFSSLWGCPWSTDHANLPLCVKNCISQLVSCKTHPCNLAQVTSCHQLTFWKKLQTAYHGMENF